jgi:hypothetical protein
MTAGDQFPQLPSMVTSIFSYSTGDHIPENSRKNMTLACLKTYEGK